MASHGSQAVGSSRSEASERFARLEYSSDDFPYYAGRPVGFSARQWALLIIAVALGFLALTATLKFLTGGWLQFIPAILFFAIPLATLAFVAPRHWAALFRRLKRRDIKRMFLFALLNLVMTLLLGWVVKSALGAAANPAFAGLSGQTLDERVLLFLKTLPQLFGEEVFTILPFLALMTLLSSQFGWSRRSAIVGGLDSFQPDVRCGPSTHLRLEPGAVAGTDRQRAPDSVVALHQDEEYLGLHGGPYHQRLDHVRSGHAAWYAGRAAISRARLTASAS